MAIKRWLAVRRWRLLWTAVALVAIRIAGTAALRFAGGDGGGGWSWTAAALTAGDAVIIALAVVAAVAFVQYGRIYRARVPTE